MLSVIDPSQITIADRPTVVGLPKGMMVEYFGQLAGGEKFVIIRPREGWNYGDFICLMESEGVAGLRNVAVLDVARYRDGGTTEVKTARGDFYFPTPFQPERKATFNGIEVNLYERSN